MCHSVCYDNFLGRSIINHTVATVVCSNFATRWKIYFQNPQNDFKTTFIVRYRTILRVLDFCCFPMFKGFLMIYQSFGPQTFSRCNKKRGGTRVPFPNGWKIISSGWVVYFVIFSCNNLVSRVPINPSLIALHLLTQHQYSTLHVVLNHMMLGSPNLEY